MKVWTPLNPRAQQAVWCCIGLAWLIALTAGFTLVHHYENTPGPNRPRPNQWPRDSRLVLNNEGATLVIFAHPKCPCTRATIGELEKIATTCGKAITPWVVFLKPKGTDDGWEHTDLWSRAAAIPGVHVINDPDGEEARRFHAQTSGQTLLYSDRGTLLFSGGITFARGHAGDNAGRAAIESYALGRSGVAQTPVFGCPLTGPCSSKP
jgi:hypothetical protein